MSGISQTLLFFHYLLYRILSMQVQVCLCLGIREALLVLVVGIFSGSLLFFWAFQKFQEAGILWSSVCFLVRQSCCRRFFCSILQRMLLFFLLRLLFFAGVRHSLVLCSLLLLSRLYAGQAFLRMSSMPSTPLMTFC